MTFVKIVLVLAIAVVFLATVYGKPAEKEVQAAPQPKENLKADSSIGLGYGFGLHSPFYAHGGWDYWGIPYGYGYGYGYGHGLYGYYPHYYPHYWW